MSSQTDALIDAILADIDAGRLRPGDTLDEASLAADHGVSRTPVREAFLKLETAGLILREKRKGATLFRPTLEQFLAILEVHAALEGQAAGLAARRLSVATSYRIEGAVADCAAHLADLGETEPDRYYQLNLAFHAAVAEASGNPYLVDMIKTNARKLMAYYRARYGYAGVIERSVAEHEEIADAILARDTDRAQALMARHVRFDEVTAMDLLAMLD